MSLHANVRQRLPSKPGNPMYIAFYINYKINGQLVL